MFNAILFLLCEATLFFLGMLTRKSKFVFTLIVFFMWLFIAFTLDSSDISNYRYSYERNAYMGKDPFYYIIQNAFVSMECSFECYKVIIGTFITFFFFLQIQKSKECVSSLAALCMLVPCGSFATGIRSAIAGVLALAAILLLTSENKFRVPIFIMTLIISSSIHQVALIYFLLIVPYLIKDKEKYIWLIKRCVLVLCVVVFFSPSIISSVASLLNGVPNVFVRTMAYRLNQMNSGIFKVTMVGFLFNAIHHFIVYYAADYYQRKEMEQLTGLFDENYKKKMVLERAFNNTLLLAIPFYQVSFHFIRVFYYVAPFMYSLMFKSIYKIRSNTGRKSYGSIGILVVCAVTIFVALWGIKQEPEDFLRIINSMFGF